MELVRSLKNNNMKNFNIQYKQLLFFYAYLRMIDLSLDRSRWGNGNEFLAYSKTMIPPKMMIKFIQENSNLEINPNLINVELPKDRNTLIKRLFKIVFNYILLSESDILYCCNVLQEFDKILTLDIKDYNFDVEALRQKIAIYYSTRLESYISSKDLKKVMQIEHFCQNENLIVFPMCEFVPSDFKN